MIFVLKENIERVSAFDIEDYLKERVVAINVHVISLHDKHLTTGRWNEADAYSTREVTYRTKSAVKNVSWSAALAVQSVIESTFRRESKSTAWSAESSAESAVPAAYEGWKVTCDLGFTAESTDESVVYHRHSIELLRLLREALER